MIWGKNVVSHTPLLSSEYVLLSLKRCTASQLYILMCNNFALVQASLPRLEIAYQTNIFFAVPPVVQETRHLDSNQGNPNVGLGANMDHLSEL